MRLIVGCGYLGTRIARQFQQESERNNVVGVVRRESEAAKLSDMGIAAFAADVTDCDSIGQLVDQIPAEPIETLIYAVGRNRSSNLPEQPYESIYREGLQNVLDTLTSRQRLDRQSRVIFISSTGVCRREDGGWVDEASETNPDSPAARAMLDAEELLRHHSTEYRSVVLRMAAIYGPGRTPPRDVFLSGKPLHRRPDRFINLIHVDDGAAAAVAASTRNWPSLNSPTAGTTFLISDGAPVTLRDYFAHYAHIAHLPAPVFESISENDIEAVKFPQRDRSSKRVSNRRLTKDLALKLTYPSYIEGLAAIVAARKNERSQ